MNGFLLFSVFFSIFLLLCPLSAANGVKHDAVESIQDLYDSITGFQTDFKQELYSRQTGSQYRKGVISFKHPGLVRWETKEPEAELLIVGKAEVWNYFKEEETVYVYSVDQVVGSKSMLNILSGKANLKENFLITAKEFKGESIRLELIPMEAEPSIVKAGLWISADTAMIEKLHIVDFYGNTNTIELHNTVLNPDLQDDLFTFTPPGGVDVVRGAP